MYLVGRNESKYGEPQIISDNQKIKVAQNLIRDEEVPGREVIFPEITILKDFFKIGKIF